MDVFWDNTPIFILAAVSTWNLTFTENILHAEYLTNTEKIILALCKLEPVVRLTRAGLRSSSTLRTLIIVGSLQINIGILYVSQTATQGPSVVRGGFRKEKYRKNCVRRWTNEKYTHVCA
jgi:hypothetical protein